MRIATRSERLSVQSTPEGTAMGTAPLSRYLVFFTIAILGCSLDLATKQWVFATLGLPGEQECWWLWQDVFGFQTSLNEGALFGIGQGGQPLRRHVGRRRRRPSSSGCLSPEPPAIGCSPSPAGLSPAGIFGNLYDRLGFPAFTGTMPTRSTKSAIASSPCGIGFL